MTEENTKSSTLGIPRPTIKPINYSTLKYWASHTIHADQHYYNKRQRQLNLKTAWAELFPNLRQPIFIVGAPRSGTTFLGNCIAELPEISYHFEPVITKAAARCIYEQQWKKENAMRFYRFVYAWLMRIHFDADLRFSEKTPRNCFLIDFLSATFPDAKFIHIIRDGRDVALSHSKKPWFKGSEASTGKVEPGGYPYGPYARFWVEADRVQEFETTSDIHRCIWSWRRFTEAALQSATTLVPHQYLEIRYESLVTHPVTTAREILNFLTISNPKSRNLFLQAAQKANPSLIGQWQKEMSHQQLFEIEQEAGALLNQLGYLSTLASPVES